MARLIGRRSLLVGGFLTAAGAAVPFGGLFNRRPPGNAPGRFGPLERDPAGILDLPRGFSYRVLGKKHELMSDGFRAPSSFDGMGCFSGPNGALILMRNHENTWFAADGPYPRGVRPSPLAYDPAAFGGVTRLVVDARTLAVRSSNLVLAGTLRNCAGGLSPWGWLSCEETDAKGHGYVFLCRSDAERLLPPERLTAYGRFNHEAACIDPSSSVAYLTEDRTDGCFYRFVPADRSASFVGKLQAMKVARSPGLDLGKGLGTGWTARVEWVPVSDPDPTDDTVRLQAHAQGAARVRRGEGAWFHGGSVYFCATTGGPAGKGQVFELDTAKEELRLLAESTDADLLDMPDNLTVAPSGEVYLAEDSIAGDQYIRGVSADGRVFDFARNAVSQSELAGICFSPDGGTLFVNVYSDGLTLAVRGPFAAA